MRATFFLVIAGKIVPDSIDKSGQFSVRALLGFIALRRKDSEATFFFFQKIVDLAYQFEQFFRVLLVGCLSTELHPAFSLLALHKEEKV